VKALFAPDSIAVFGASDRPGTWGHHLAQGALRSGADVQLINRRPPFQTALTRPCELAVVAVPAADFESTVDAALSAGAQAVVGITAGASPSASLIARVRRAGAVLLGPNCLGVFDARSELNLLWGELPPGDITLFSHSGNLALELGAIARRGGLGFRRFASLGDCADLRAADLLAHHGDARAVALYLEDFTDGRSLLAAAASVVDSGVPVALLAGGRSSVGAAAAASHTGALAGDRAVLAAACASAGVRLVDTPVELIEACRGSFARKGIRRIGIVADGGGHGIVAADLATARGLAVPVPPTDLAGAGEQDLGSYAREVAKLADSGAVDAVLLTGYFGGYAVDEPTLAAAEAAAADSLVAVAARFPVLVHSFAGFTADGPSPTVRRLTAAGVPVWPAVEHALTAAVPLSQDRAPQDRTPQDPAPQDPGRIRDIARILDQDPYINPDPARILGDPYWSLCELLPGVAYARGERVTDLDGALLAAKAIGYPVVLKALGRAHKSDGGGVALNLADEAALAHAWSRLPKAAEYAVEEQVDVRTGVEMIVGGRRDPSFGPVVVVGAGGILAELLADSAVAPAPVDHAIACILINELRVARLLAGYRGSRALDVDSLADVVVAVSEAIAVDARIAALELNPVLVRERGSVALDRHWENVS
jgi:acyl-CoA synthetase (NDP forming)